MRKQRYLGALDAHGGYLVLSTLRRADQVLSFAGVQPAKAATPHANEIKLAEQLVNSISGNFDPSQWHNEYRQRVRDLVEAKARGDTLKPVKPKSRPAEGDLTASLKASLAALKDRRVAAT
jgi:DNA end-binding protein Ku